ncbi:MAG TPA: 5,6-dimethylbenzimidazole synthase [Paracoccus sp. (in: a-proteobacteria)]|nr:5,6-dimethylbenzimidazole synthase [Paracoccus sp. (in: a-proteobacteria)]
MQFSDRDLDQLMTLLKWRRDTRHFRPDPVPETALARLAEAMSLSPSVGNARPWRVLRVRDPRVRNEVRAIFEACNAEAARRYPADRRADYERLKLAGLDVAPVQLAVFTHTDPAAGHGLGRQTMPETLAQSTAMAIHALWLAARAQNLGVGMVSILEPDRIERLLEVPGDWRFTAWLCVGYPEFDDDLPLLHRAQWQENAESAWIER